MPNIRVRLFATLRQYRPGTRPGEGFALELEDGTAVAQITEILGIPPEIVKLVFVNGLVRDGDYVFAEGDDVGVFPPIAGG